MNPRTLDEYTKQQMYQQAKQNGKIVDVIAEPEKVKWTKLNLNWDIYRLLLKHIGKMLPAILTQLIIDWSEKTGIHRNKWQYNWVLAWWGNDPLPYMTNFTRYNSMTLLLISVSRVERVKQCQWQLDSRIYTSVWNLKRPNCILKIWTWKFRIPLQYSTRKYCTLGGAIFTITR